MNNVVSRFSLSLLMAPAISTVLFLHSPEAKSAPTKLEVLQHNCGLLPAGSSCQIDLNLRSDVELTTVKYLNYTVNGKTYSVKVNAKVAEADLQITPSLSDWGEVPFYSNTEKIVTIKNISEKTVSDIKVELPPLFKTASTTCQQTLAPAQSCTYRLVYTPVETAAENTTRTAELINNGDITSIPFKLRGGGRGAVVLSSPSSLSWGTVNVHVNSPLLKLVLKNAGNVSAELKNMTILNNKFTVVSTTCSQTLTAGQSCDVNLQLNTVANGPVTDTLEIESTSDKNPKLAIALNAVVNGAMLVANPEKVLFGEVNYGSNTKKTSTLTNQGNKPLKIVSVDVSSYLMDVTSTCQAGQTLQPKETCSVAFRMDTSDRAKDGTNASVRIATDTSDPVTVIDSQGITRGSYLVLPTQVRSELTKVGYSSLVIATLRNAAYEPLNLTDVSIASNEGSNSWSALTHNCTNIGYNQTCQVKARFTPNSYGDSPATVSFKSNDARYPSGQFTMIGEGTDSNIVFYVDGTLAKTFNFGEIAFNSPVSKTISVVNTGPQPATITGIYSNNGAWSSQGCYNQTLATGAKCDLTLSSPVPYVAGPALNRAGMFTLTFDKEANKSFDISYKPVGPWVELSPSAISFGDPTPYNITKTQAISISNTGNKPLEFLKWQLSGDSNNEILLDKGTCSSTVAVNSSCTAQIRYTSKKEGSVRTTLTITTNSNAGTNGSLVIPISATSVEAMPKISINLSGTALTKTRNLYIYNAGSSGMTIQGLTLSMTKGTGSLVNGYASCPAVSAKSICSIPVYLQGEQLAGSITLKITGAGGIDGQGTVQLPLVEDTSIAPLENNEAVDFPGAFPTTSRWYAAWYHGNALVDQNYSTYISPKYTGGWETSELIFHTEYGQYINKLVAHVRNTSDVPLELGMYDRSASSYGLIYNLVGKTTVPAKYEGLATITFPNFYALPGPPPYYDRYWGLLVNKVGEAPNFLDKYGPFLQINELRVGRTP